MQTLTSTGSVMRGNILNVLRVGEGPAPSGPHSSPGCPRRGNIHCNIFFYSHSNAFSFCLNTLF